MKLNRNLGLLIVAAVLGSGAAAAATTAPTSASTSAAATDGAGRHWHHHRGGMLVGVMLHAAHQLDLTSDQQATIKGILATARSQHQQAPAAGAVDMSVLANPGDPNYAAALQSAKARVDARLQNEVELQSQIYNVLTAEQKAKLPQVLAAMKTKGEARRAAWQQQRAAGTAEAAGSN